MKRRVKRKFRESSARRKRRKKLEAGPHKFLKQHRKRIQLRDNPSKKSNALTWLVLIFGVGATISAFAKGKQ